MVTNETAACDCPQVDPFPSSASALTGSSLGEENIPFQVFYQAHLFLK